MAIFLELYQEMILKYMPLNYPTQQNETAEEWTFMHT